MIISKKSGLIEKEMFKEGFSKYFLFKRKQKKRPLNRKNVG